MVWESISSVIQAIATVVLVVVTIFYAFRTHTIATATKTMADETAAMVRLEKMRQRDAVRPVLMFNVHSESDLSRVDSPGAKRDFEKTTIIQVLNGGTGPALEVRIHLTSKEAQLFDNVIISVARLVPIAQPFTLVTGSSVELELNWRIISLAASEAEEQVLETGHRDRFMALGTLMASYQDIYGRSLKSAGNLEIQLDMPSGLPVRVSSFEQSVTKTTVHEPSND